MPDLPPGPEPFTPQTAPAALENLRLRLRATRWPDTPEDAGWSVPYDPPVRMVEVPQNAQAAADQRKRSLRHLADQRHG